MNVDVVAFYQGVINARNKRVIGETLADDIKKKIYEYAKPGKYGRYEIQYIALMEIITNLSSFHMYEIIGLWEHIGHSIAEGLGVANN